jgi:NAD(P)-dependent dehydrogenase (short-subunit alcohol dehydrogenase family)
MAQQNEPHWVDDLRRAVDPFAVASRVAGWLVNPRGSVSQRALERAVGGKSVLVTGASHGIGEATARKLGQAGATTLLVARSEERLDDLQAWIAERGGTAYAYATDLADPEQVEALCEEVLERHGHVDVLVNNAGKSIRRSLELSYERFHDFERTIDINYLGPVRLLLGLVPAMRARGEGHIVNVSTIGARIPPGPRWGAYQASKSAFDVFLRSAALEARSDGVIVTSIYMALVRTRMSAPTPIFRYIPALTPEQAADVVCKAIVDRPREITPWWASLAELGFALTRTPWELGARLVYRLTEDTPSAGGRERGAPPGQVPRAPSRTGRR